MDSALANSTVGGTGHPLQPLPSGGLRLRGRLFTPDELRLIRGITSSSYIRGRTRISVEVCEALDWTQPNGWLKDRACRDVLRELEHRGLIHLPPVATATSKVRYSNWAPPTHDLALAQGEVQRLTEPVRLELAKGGSNEATWNALVQKYHYLGHKVAVGKCLKFLVHSGDRIIGAASLADSTWAMAARDKLLRALNLERTQVCNNNRFLILPMFRIRNLASVILSRLVVEGTKCWRNYYSTDVKLVETFVDPTRFSGTIYRAANWFYIGQSKGYQKRGRSHANSQEPKQIYLYPLQRSLRKRLAALLASAPIQ